MNKDIQMFPPVDPKIDSWTSLISHPWDIIEIIQLFDTDMPTQLKTLPKCNVTKIQGNALDQFEELLVELGSGCEFEL